MRIARTTPWVALALLLAVGSGPTVAQVQSGYYVALGDSLTAGYASGGLAQSYQAHSYPAILARQLGVPSTLFQQPLVSDPGIPAVQELKSLAVSGGTIVPTIAPKSGSGQPINATYSGMYGNLGIPGAKTGDLLTKTGDITKLQRGIIDPNTIMYDIVLRFPVFPGTTTPAPAVAQAVALPGTFYTVWIGNNDVLGAALTGVAVDDVTLTRKEVFQAQYTALLGVLKQGAPSAKMMVANIPDVASIPFVTTVKPYIFGSQGQKVYLLGENGPLTDADYLTLSASSLIAQGFGVPGTGKPPLPEGAITATGLQAGVILRAAEVAAIRVRTAELNAIIAAVAAQVGAKVFDANAFFAGVVRNGYSVGGIKLTPEFLTGGLFSYDGVHPQTLGYAIVANEMINTINREFGTKVPAVDLRPYLLGARAATTVQAAGAVFSLEAYRSLLQIFAPNADTSYFNQPRPAARPAPARRVERQPLPVPAPRP
ncbi:MAG: hypothetical protein HRF46_14890 [Acidobacteriota bacterium]